MSSRGASRLVRLHSTPQPALTPQPSSTTFCRLPESSPLPLPPTSAQPTKRRLDSTNDNAPSGSSDEDDDEEDDMSEEESDVDDEDPNGESTSSSRHRSSGFASSTATEPGALGRLLPQSALKKLIKRILGKVRVSPEATDLLNAVGTEFVAATSRVAMQRCESDHRMLITPDDLLKSLSSIGCDSIVRQLQDGVGADGGVVSAVSDAKHRRASEPAAPLAMTTAAWKSLGKTKSNRRRDRALSQVDIEKLQAQQLALLLEAGQAEEAAAQQQQFLQSPPELLVAAASLLPKEQLQACPEQAVESSVSNPSIHIAASTTSRNDEDDYDS